MIRMVTFDLDDTLYDYQACNVIAEEKVLEMISLRLFVDRREAGELFRRAKVNVKNQLGDVAASHNRLLYMQNLCEQKGISPLKYALEFQNIYWETILKEMQPFSYVRPLFRYLRERDIKTGILTDMVTDIQYKKIVKLGLDEEIDVITTSEEAGEEKPSRKIFDKMLSKVSYKPEEVLMIGDSVLKDVQGAVNAGMQALHFERNMDITGRVKELLCNYR